MMKALALTYRKIVSGLLYSTGGLTIWSRQQPVKILENSLNISYGLPGKTKINAAASPPKGWITLPMSGMKMAQSTERKNHTIASIRSLVNCHRSNDSLLTLVNVNNPATNELSKADLSEANIVIFTPSALTSVTLFNDIKFGSKTIHKWYWQGKFSEFAVYTELGVQCQYLN